MHIQCIIKRNKKKVLMHSTVCMNLHNIMLSKSSQTQKVTCCMIPFTGNIQNRYICLYRTQLLVARGWGRGGWGETAYQVKGFYFGVIIEMFCNQIAVVPAHCKYTKYHRVFHFKMVNFMFCEFHLNTLFLKRKT